MNSEITNPVQQYLEKWANVRQTQEAMNLPQIRKSYQIVSNNSHKLGFETRRNIISPSRKLNIKNSIEMKKQWLSPRVGKEKVSLNENKQNLLSDDDKAWVETHLKMISRTKKIVENAKAARFRGFFSPRVLRNKINNFAILNDNRNWKNDSSSDEEVIESVRKIIPKQDMEILINKICKKKVKKIRFDTKVDSNWDKGKLYPLKHVHENNSNDIPCNILCRS